MPAIIEFYLPVPASRASPPLPPPKYNPCKGKESVDDCPVIRPAPTIGKQVEPLYGTEYSWEPLSEELLQSWEACGRDPDVRLPDPNSYVATVRSETRQSEEQCSPRGEGGGGGSRRGTGGRARHEPFRTMAAFQGTPGIPGTPSGLGRVYSLFAVKGSLGAPQRSPRVSRSLPSARTLRPCPSEAVRAAEAERVAATSDLSRPSPAPAASGGGMRVRRALPDDIDAGRGFLPARVRSEYSVRAGGVGGPRGIARADTDEADRLGGGRGGAEAVSGADLRGRQGRVDLDQRGLVSAREEPR